ncbi:MULTISPECIES: 2-hydroxyacid dehydrogenase [Diaphorobacter]|uniref:D-isomer specific 2-hydroxyacid dehydrogenase NAD-binding n=1 Tax=Acidovorax ebreus (strain TPSY) TaxID=535289 RepID=A0A9J9Q8Q9_ACIET|nr:MULTISPECIES: D-glycerate dehydrogenase [Diaphorobacter]ABM42651.1 D-isomer specific 2-hydroxyacid dehydrogenase, NAD-binding protein [Acidovorax sp. JS42]PZU42999.1 MAG: D-glycerate dehydrogenase [Acidovorax sp.]ACM32834.1 D-isomer specific 2-hydroxyacid dehydrogenase NAD-binding [[Acidovorax] ebreus TPSY]KLR59679.1 2-hydroxyacid dehydrogenase [Diaphorobacter sp. J5-51]MBV2217295.1 D-glycerate dehydrogenase [Diaphorobacter sp.]
MSKPHILVARKIFPEVIERLTQHFEVYANQDDNLWTQAELIERLQGKDGALLTGTQPVNAELLAACPQLRIAANMTVGYNNFDIAAMTAAGVQGTNTPDVLTETTADFGFALLMATARRITESEHYLRAGQWTRWSYDMFAGCEVHGSTLGILGMGRIGQGIAKRGAHGFGMNVIYHNRSRLSPALEAECKARYVGKDELLAQADHLVLVLPYTPESHHAIGAAEIARMKPTATLINIARGGIVDDAALAQALKERRIAAAGLDVFEGEPAVHPALLEVPNVVLTPHIASATVPTRLAMAQLAADNLVAFFDGRGALTPVNTPAKV